MEIGKLTSELLNKHVFEPLRELPKRPETKLRPGPGEDCAVLDFSGEVLLSADPITGAAEDIGYLAVHVNANDIAASGGEPVGIMLTVLLPPASASECEAALAEIMSGAIRAAKEVNIDLLGGHTEVTDAVTRPVVSAAIIGKAAKAVATSGAVPGNALVMTKYAGLEGTVIITKERAETAKRLGVFESAVARASEISILREAAIAAEFASAMHDITEGGVLGACYELAEASGTGVLLELDEVPLLDETVILCREFGLDPYALISSGCLLIAAEDGDGLADRINKAGIPARVIGKITEKERQYKKGGVLYELPPPMSDEIYKL